MNKNFNLVNYCEIDKYASTSYSAIHEVDESLNLGDITQIDISKLPKDITLLTHGSPCFTADTLVLTKDGYKNIVDVKVGDYVLDHTNNYNKVTNFFNQEKKKIWKIKPMCSVEIKTTENHKFLVRDRYHEWNNEKRSYERKFTNTKWVECRQLDKNKYLGISINQESKLPEYHGVECIRGNQSYIKCNLDMNDKKLWYVCGRYLGDGWTRNRKERNDNLSSVIICCGKHKIDKFERELEGWLNYCKIEERTAFKYSFSNKELATFINQFGKGAKNKHIPSFVFDLPTEYIKEILRGYFDSDGYCDSGTHYKVSSISKELIYGIGQLVAKAYKRPYSIYTTKNKPTKMIEGRIVNQNELTYILSFKTSDNKYDHAFYENGYIWCPITEITETDDYEEVYDIEVENTHSLTANGVIAHNCQSYSLAGLQHGGDEGSGTRSSLMWNTVQIVKEIKPKIILWENVKNVLSVKHRHNFDKYINTLDEYGYNNYYKVINSKDHGVPQNRERIFVISIRKDIDNGEFKFPEPYKLKKRLKDLLEEEVDEKYYLSDEQISRIENSSYIQNQRRIQEKQWCDTLWARDWKDPKCVEVEEPKIKRLYGIYDTEKRTREAGAVYEESGLAPTLNTCGGGYRMPLIEDNKLKNLIDNEKIENRRPEVGGGITIPEATKKGYKVAYEGDGVYINRPHQKRGCVQRDMIQTLKTSSNDLGVVVGTYQYAKSDKFMNGKSRFNEGKDYSDTIQTSPKEGVVFAQCNNEGESTMENLNNEIKKRLRIRKLTPKECWRIMDFDDIDFEKAKESLNETYYKGRDRSATQLYKQAGNSIVVNVLYEIFLELYKVLPNEFDNLTLLSLFSGIGSPEKALDRLYENVINKE